MFIMVMHTHRYVFDEVHENSMEIWKYEMLRLVQEFDEKPGLAPPFIIIEHVWLLFKGIWKICCRREKEDCILHRCSFFASMLCLIICVRYTVNASNFGSRKLGTLFFPWDLLLPKRVLQKNEENESCKKKLDLQTWFCSFLVHNSPSKDVMNLGRKSPKFL